MPIPLSVDLRERVIAAVDNGMHIDDAAALFKVCGRVIYNWLELRETTKTLAPKVGYQRGHSHKIKDWDEFKAFAEENKYCTIIEMKHLWDAKTNDIVAKSVIQRGLKKIGFTSKKKLLITQKPMLQNAQNF